MTPTPLTPLHYVPTSPDAGVLAVRTSRGVPLELVFFHGAGHTQSFACWRWRGRGLLIVRAGQA